MLSLINMLWCITTLLLILSFPIQVIFMSEWPAIFPYLLIILIMIIRLRFKSAGTMLKQRRSKRMESLIGLYLVLLFVNISWQTIAQILSLYQAGVKCFIYGIPVFFYWYFNRYASRMEIKSVLIGIALAGTLTGVFFAYDSIGKLGYGRISSYSRDAIAYSASRGLGGTDWRSASSMRAELNNRSFGLLESHTISGTVTAFGAFALLSLITKFKRFTRMVVAAFFLFLLISGLNFTSLVGYIFVLMAVEFRIISLGKQLSEKLIKNLLFVMILGVLILLFSIYAFNESMLQYILKIMNSQIKLATIGRGDISYLQLIVDYWQRFLESIPDFPITLLIGDGYSSSFGMAKGGDVGFIETMSRLGVPLFFLIIINILKICWEYLKNDYFEYLGQPSVMWVNSLKEFSISVIVFLVVMELHYSAWNSKAIFPIFFIALALYTRFKFFTFHCDQGDKFNYNFNKLR